MKNLLPCLVLLLAASPTPAGFNVIVNGNFESGNTGFTTAYNYSPGELGPARTYDVVSNPAIDRPRDISPVSYGDHTTGTGLMMAVNGADAADVLVWGQTVTVAAGTDYAFSFWLSSWFASSPSKLDVLFNGVSVGTPTAPSAVATWQEFGTTWNSGSATSLVIQIRTVEGADVGGDFAIDDISLVGPDVTVTPVPPSLLLAVSGAGVVALGWLRRKVCLPALKGR